MFKKITQLFLCGALACGVIIPTAIYSGTDVAVNAYDEPAPSSTSKAESLNWSRYNDIENYRKSFTSYYNKKLTGYLNDTKTVSKEDYNKVRNQFKTAKAKYNLNAQGFFEYMAEKGDTGAEDALAVIKKQGTGDAMSILTLKDAMQIIKDCNKIRKKEGLKQLKVTSYLMAVSQAQLNWSYLYYKNNGALEHSRLYNVGENIAFGYGYPFFGWYYQEKDLYNKGNRDPHKIGHYKNIIDASYVYTGAAFIYKRGFSGQVFQNSSTHKAYSVSKYEEYLDEYLKNVAYDYYRAKAKLDAYYALYYGKTTASISTLNPRNTSYNLKVTAKAFLREKTSYNRVANAKVKIKFKTSVTDSWVYLQSPLTNKKGEVSVSKKVTVKYKYTKKYNYYKDYNSLDNSQKSAADTLIKAGLMYKTRADAVNQQNKDIVAYNKKLSKKDYQIRITPSKLPKGYTGFTTVVKKVTSSNVNSWIKIKVK